ncbi:MAG: phosphatidylserine decarboxylase [Gammaproteobacteria bacterium]|nr:phosphatidylserine decarboxylase [Gammaproteobacteria bacterium]
MIDFLKTFWQYLVPKHFLSTLMHWLMNRETPWFSQFIIKQFVAFYGVNLAEAERTAIEDYRSVNDFFTRSLAADARPIDTNLNSIVSPADGKISQSGSLKHNQIIQAKGYDYSVEALLGGDISLAKSFYDGDFAVVYLSPKDYHRIHMPMDGQLLSMTYVPGDLFAVNPATVRMVPDLFARNERLVLSFETAIGPMVLVMVGAIFVGSMETVWQGKITPDYGTSLKYWDYTDQSLHFAKGEEIGRFNMGSTVVMLLPAGKTYGLNLHDDNPVLMGQAIASIVNKDKQDNAPAKDVNDSNDDAIDYASA